MQYHRIRTFSLWKMLPHTFQEWLYSCDATGMPADLVCTRSQDSTTACVDATARRPLRYETLTAVMMMLSWHFDLSVRRGAQV